MKRFEESDWLRIGECLCMCVCVCVLERETEIEGERECERERERKKMCDHLKAFQKCVKAIKRTYLFYYIHNFITILFLLLVWHFFVESEQRRTSRNRTRDRESDCVCVCINI